MKLVNIKEGLLGQYKGYREEAKKADLEEKRIETFAKIELNCKTKRWTGVKLILRTGKKLNRKFGEIAINFKSLDSDYGNQGISKNKILIGIYPKQDVNIIMNSTDFSSKEKGRATLVNFEFCKECKFGPNSVDEYAFLISEVLKGNKMYFSTDREVKEAWRIVDEIERKKKKMKFVYYEDGEEPEF